MTPHVSQQAALRLMQLTVCLDSQTPQLIATYKQLCAGFADAVAGKAAEDLPPIPEKAALDLMEIAVNLSRNREFLKGSSAGNCLEDFGLLCRALVEAVGQDEFTPKLSPVMQSILHYRSRREEEND